MVKIFIISISFIVLIAWLYILERKKHCPKCGGTKLDRAGNDYYCRDCRILWHMNQFGKLKERN